MQFGFPMRWRLLHQLRFNLIGERYNLTTNAGNTGLGIGLIHYLNFSYTAEYILLTRILMITLNYEVVSYNKTDLKQFGDLWLQTFP
jgi:hypothetical protein